MSEARERFLVDMAERDLEEEGHGRGYSLKKEVGAFYLSQNPSGIRKIQSVH